MTKLTTRVALILAVALAGCGSGGSGGGNGGSGGNGGNGGNGGSGGKGGSGKGGSGSPGKPLNPTDAASACATETFPTSGTIVYVCDCQAEADANCKPGDDSHDGMTAATALKSYDKMVAKYGAIPAGGTVALCRGGAFTATKNAMVSNLNCTAASPCVLRDYVPSDWTPAVDHQPIIHAGASTNGLELNNNTAHQEGFRILNLDFEGDGTSNSQGLFLYDDLSDVFVCNVTFNGLQAGILLDGSTPYPPTGCYSPGPPIVDNCPIQRRITMQGNTFTNIAVMGFFGYGISVDLNYNYWEKCGTDNALDHVVYFGPEELDNSTPITQALMQDEHFIGNIIVDPGSAGTCDGTIVVAHGAHTGLVVQNNTISIPTNTITGNCYGIGVESATGNYSDLLQSALVDSNTIQAYGEVGIAVSSCQNCTVSNNLIMTDNKDATSGPFCILSGGGVVDEYDLGSTDTTIVNNTCYYANAGNYGRGISITSEGSGYVVANNVIDFDTTMGKRTFYCTDYQLGDQTLVGGTVTSSVSTYTGITNGGFDFSVNGTNVKVSGLNFSSAKNIWDVTAALTKTVSGLVAGSKVTWMGNNLIINTKASATTATTLSVASSPTAGGGVTDVSKTLGLSSAGGGAVKATYAYSDHSLCYAGGGSTAVWDLTTPLSLADWTTTMQLDGASQVNDPQFVNAAATSGYDFHPATGSPLIGAGSAMYAPMLDISGKSRPNPPSIGAYE